MTSGLIAAGTHLSASDNETEQILRELRRNYTPPPQPEPMHRSRSIERHRRSQRKYPKQAKAIDRPMKSRGRYR